MIIQCWGRRGDSTKFWF